MSSWTLNQAPAEGLVYSLVYTLPRSAYCLIHCSSHEVGLLLLQRWTVMSGVPERAKVSQDSSPTLHSLQSHVHWLNTCFSCAAQGPPSSPGLGAATDMKPPGSQSARRAGSNLLIFVLSLTRAAQRCTHSTSMHCVSLYGGTVLGLGHIGDQNK